MSSHLDPDLAGGESDFAERLMSDVTNRNFGVMVSREGTSAFTVSTEDGTTYLVTVEDVTG
jgi:hypothetical protein